jgi:Protein of unknown function (DUF4058)
MVAEAMICPLLFPHLENSEFWSAVHSRLIVAIADDLVDHLSEKYRVEIEKRAYFSLITHRNSAISPAFLMTRDKVVTLVNTSNTSLSGNEITY